MSIATTASSRKSPRSVIERFEPMANNGPRPMAIPSLDGFDRETRQSIEFACSWERMNGPVAYGKCLNRQIQSLDETVDRSSTQNP